MLLRIKRRGGYFLLALALVCSFQDLLANPKNPFIVPNENNPVRSPGYQNRHSASKNNSAKDIIGDLIEAKKFKEALTQVDKKIEEDPTNIDLLYLKAVILMEQERYDKAVWVLDQIFDLDRENAKALALLKTIEKLDSRHVSNLNTIVLNNTTADVEQKNPEEIKNDIWTYSLFLYSHRFSSGTLSAQVNEASRFGQTGFQYQAIAYPKLIGSSYLYLSYAYSNSTLFPSNYYAGEIYIPFLEHVTVSAGASYYEVLQSSFILNTYSLDIYFSAYEATVRSNYYIPKMGKRSLYWIINIKRFFDNPDNFIGLQVETGETPDLADLDSIGFFIIDATAVRLFTQFHLVNGVFLQLAVGTTNENYFSTRRIKLFGGVGLKFRF